MIEVRYLRINHRLLVGAVHELNGYLLLERAVGSKAFH
jgi:hypothetical protein